MKFFTSLSPFSKVVAGLILGILFGIFIGEPAGVLEIGGNAHIRLLQVTVLPCILVSLISGLGRLGARNPAQCHCHEGGFAARVFAW